MSGFDLAAYQAAELRLHEAAVEYARARAGQPWGDTLSKLLSAALDYAKVTPALSFTEQEADRNARGDVAWAELNTDPYEHPGYCDNPDCRPCGRPCCHTTGPNHHPACQESK